MIARIAKDFHWEMGHRLPYHDGGCQNVHGHSYRMRVELVGEVDAQGMVMDYFDIKAAVEPLIERLDHSFLCDESDDVMKALFNKQSFKVNYVPFYTTAENIAHYILQELLPSFRGRPGLQSLTVRLHETERTFAELSAQL